MFHNNGLEIWPSSHNTYFIASSVKLYQLAELCISGAFSEMYCLSLSHVFIKRLLSSLDRENIEHLSNCYPYINTYRFIHPNPWKGFSNNDQKTIEQTKFHKFHVV